jgi:hypothetical protein
MSALAATTLPPVSAQPLLTLVTPEVDPEVDAVVAAAERAVE